MKSRSEVEADAVRGALEKMRENGAFPARPVIKRFDVVPENDSTGDPAYYIAVLLDDDTPEQDLTRDNVKPIERLVFDNVVRGPDEPWPYVQVLREREYLAPVEDW